MSSTATADPGVTTLATRQRQRLIVAWGHPRTREIIPVGILEVGGRTYSYIELSAHPPRRFEFFSGSRWETLA